MDHLKFINLAYDLALKGWGHVSPNPMVGAVLVKSGRVIAEGWHPFYGGPHAEAMAIAAAGAKAQGADLYVTLEPCSHVGKTPPCTRTIIQAGIKRVFVGTRDPNPKMNGRSIRILQKAGIVVQVGFLEKELKAMNESFNHYIVHKQPFVTAKIAQTLDGKIANKNGESRWITSEETRAYAHDLRFGHDAIIVGINTVLKDNPALNSTPRKSIKKIILDTHLRMPTTGKIYTQTKAQDILIFTSIKKTKKLNATIIQAPLKNRKIDLKWVLHYLGEQQIANVLIEGGSQVIGNALKRGLVQKMMVYVAPKIMGEGLIAIAGVETSQLKNILTLKNTQMGRIGNDILIEGYLQ